MEAYVLDKNGTVSALPVLLSWEILHSAENCDSVELTMPLTEGLAGILDTAAELRCDHQGKQVFCGVADEYALSAGADGATARLSGRGYGAYLLDNEAESAEYWSPRLEQILENHVYPFRIRNVRFRDMGCTGRFPVSSGESQWRVLRDFCFFAGGITPRFDRNGTLLLTGEAGETVDLSGAAIVEQSWTSRRYGVFSHVLVRSVDRGSAVLVENPELIARGGLCRRVVNVPRYTQYDAMRHTGEYQISRSKKGSRVMELTIPALFAAFAGDRVLLRSSPLGLSGRFFVLESRCTADGRGGETRLRLEREE